MRKHSVVAFSFILLAVMAFVALAAIQNAQPAAENKTPILQSQPRPRTFRQKGSGIELPDFGFMVKPAEYTQKYSDQPIFRFKADFPKEKPEQVPAFVEQIDFKKNPDEYLLTRRATTFEGNLPDWDPYKNQLAGWYHIPWLHPTTTGP